MAAEKLGILEKVVGKVKLRRSAQKRYLPAVPNDELFAGDRIRTSAHGKATLRLVDGSSVNLAEATHLKLNKMELKGLNRDTELELLEGSIRAQVSKVKGPFDILTGNSLASVRGTDFTVSAKNRSSIYFQNEGSIDVKTAGASVNLKSDMMTTNYQGKTPLPPISVSQDPSLTAVRDGMNALTSTDIPPSIE